MKNISVTILFACILFLSFSCKKEIVHTPADAVTNQLNEIIKKNGITRILAWTDKRGFPDYYPDYIGLKWDISNGFISIYGMGSDSSPYLKWNLSYLDRYSVQNSPRILFLHFKDSALIVQ